MDSGRGTASGASGRGTTSPGLLNPCLRVSRTRRSRAHPPRWGYALRAPGTRLSGLAGGVQSPWLARPPPSGPSRRTAVAADNPVVGQIASLWRYPVKSMQGEELNASAVTERGLLGDRAFALVDASEGRVASAKNPRRW